MLIGLQQRRLRPLRSPDDPGGSGGSGGNPPAPPAGDPPTLTPPSDPATPPAPADAGAPKPRKPRAPRAPKPPVAPPDTVVNVSPKVQNIVDKVEGLPTPGGLVLLLALIVILLFAIVPVAGKRTRLRLLWDTARGKTGLPDPTQASASSSSGTPGVLPGGIDNTPVGMAPTLQSTGSGSPLSPALTAGSLGMSATASGYEDNGAAYPDMWQEAAYPQGYPGETEYIVPDFPEY